MSLLSISGTAATARGVVLMVYPMMEVTKFGVNIESTILEGVISF